MIRMMKDKASNFDGSLYYEAAIRLTDRYDKRFCDMLAADSKSSNAERHFFTGEFRGLELMGWAAFCEKMRVTGQGAWLEKIESLDDDVMLRVFGEQMLNARDKETMDLAVKALTGLLNRRKMRDGGDGSSAGNGDTITYNVYIKGAEGGCEDGTD